MQYLYDSDLCLTKVRGCELSPPLLLSLASLLVFESLQERLPSQPEHPESTVIATVIAIAIVIVIVMFASMT